MDVLEMCRGYQLSPYLPVEHLQMIVLEYSGHLRRGARSACWFLWT